jgi:TPR repeat protein
MSTPNKILLLLCVLASFSAHSKALTDAELIARLGADRDFDGDSKARAVDASYQATRRELIAELVRKPKAFLEISEPDFQLGSYLCRYNLGGYYPDTSTRVNDHTANWAGGWAGHCVMDTKRVNRATLAAELLLEPENADQNIDIWRQALKYYEMGASAKDHYAMLALGYYYGRDAKLGRALNPSKAARWLKASADLGNGDGMAALAYYYEFGLGGLKKDLRQALKLYTSALDHNAWLATVRLAPLYESMTDLPDNRKNALVWYAIWGRSGIRGADYAVERRNALSELVTTEELKQAKAESAAYFDAHPERAIPAPPALPVEESE